MQSSKQDIPMIESEKLNDAEVDSQDEGSTDSGSRKRKFRQHVNPLASTYQQPAEMPTDWVQVSFFPLSKTFPNLSTSPFNLKLCVLNVERALDHIQNSEQSLHS
jgi:hypothetical protein